MCLIISPKMSRKMAKGRHQEQQRLQKRYLLCSPQLLNSSSNTHLQIKQLLLYNQESLHHHLHCHHSEIDHFLHHITGFHHSPTRFPSKEHLNWDKQVKAQLHHHIHMHSNNNSSSSLPHPWAQQVFK